jgi:hypothetical protein
MLKLFITLFLFLLISYGYGQTVIIAENVGKLNGESDFGMNRKHYAHSFLSVLFVAGPPEQPGAEVLYGKSRSLEFGYRYKRRLSNTFSLGSEITGRRHAFHMKQSDSKTVPNTMRRDSEKLVFLEAGLGLYKRINFGQRGNYIGRFVDAGVYASWIFHTRHIYFYEEEDVKYRVRITGMNYPASINYGFMARMGFGNWVVKGTYRMSGLFKESSGLPDLPKYAIGIELGLHPS